jgi:hypothetical protein
MFLINTILAWNINIIMNKKYDNNNIIIASRAYFLQTPTCTRVNNLVNTCAFNTYGILVLFIRFTRGKLLYGADTFRSVCICIFFCVSMHYSSCMRWHRINLVFWWDPFVSWPRLCCHYCHTIELHSTNTLGTTPSSHAASRVIIYLALIIVSVTMFNTGTHPSHHGIFFHLIVPPYNSKQIA